MTGFPAVSDPGARVLILGTMPSAASLARGEYYGNPRNRFWDVMGALVGAGREHRYAQRLQRLTARGIALWDVAHRCRRARSADASIRDVAPNDFAGFLAAHADLAALFFNGNKAASLFAQLVAPKPARDLHRETLPSTSPAMAGMRWPEKLRRWRAVLRWL